MLWVELAGGVGPIIYRSKKCLRLVKPEHLIARYCLPIKAGALRKLKSTPDQFEHSQLVRDSLLSMDTVQPVAWVQRKRLRKYVLREIQLSIVEKVNAEKDTV